MPLDLTCEDFGLTQEEMLERLINKMADRLLEFRDEDCDPDTGEGYGVATTTKLKQKLTHIIEERIDNNVRLIAEKHVLPKVDDMIKNLTFQKTSNWGEPKSPPENVREYITRVATDYLGEEVNSSGKTKKEDSYSWEKHSTRLVYSIENHVLWHLNEEMKRATKDLQATFANHVADMVKETLKSVQIKGALSIKR